MKVEKPTTNVYKLYIILLFCFLSCDKDSNTFLYQEAEQITVEGISENYSVISYKDTLKINPQINSNNVDVDYEYAWGVYELNSTGTLPKLDTISRQKNLNYFVELPAKSYALVNIVTNKKTGLSKYSSVRLTVNTEFTRGWYVLKDDGMQSDLDQFLTEGTIIPEAQANEDVFSKVNGFKLDGKGKRLTFINDYKSTVQTASPANTRTLFVGTENNVSAVFINTIKQIKDRKSIFFGGEREVCKNVCVFIGSQTINMINNGRSYGIYAMSLNSGTFGTYAMRDDNNTPYELSPFFLTEGLINPIFFDNVTSSFVSTSFAGPVLTNITDADGTMLPAQNNNKTLSYMSYQRASGTSFFATGFFEDKSNPNLKIISTLETVRNSNKLKILCDTLETTDKLFNSSKHTVLVSAENLLYFVHNNRDVYSYNLSNGFERLQFAVPAGEEVTFIRHRRYNESGYAFDYVMVGSKAGGEYKIRMFEKTAGNLNTEPKFILSGKGAPRDVMYISPSVSSRTYPTGY